MLIMVQFPHVICPIRISTESISDGLIIPWQQKKNKRFSDFCFVLSFCFRYVLFSLPIFCLILQDAIHPSTCRGWGISCLYYVKLAIKEHYSKRQLERQIDSGYYERYMLSKEKLLPESIPAEQNPFLDSYIIEFLDLPDSFHENDLRRALVKGMRDFILELGKDFTFVGEEYSIHVGGEDFRIDLVFFHRVLRCLVAIELKIGKFKPEYISKMDFYLEGLDRQVKKSDENPSVGVILCASKDDEVVEYAMSRTMSPMMVSQYQLQLPDKEILRRKLQELTELTLDNNPE